MGDKLVSSLVGVRGIQQRQSTAPSLRKLLPSDGPNIFY